MTMGKETKKANRMMPKLFFAALFTWVLFLSGQAVCFASTVVLQWDTLTGITGYKVYYQADSATQPFQGTGATEGKSPIAIPNPVGQSTTSATISNLDPTRTYYFAVTTYNASGESAYSNIVAINALSVTLSGTGAGNVNSSPSGMSCVSGTCATQFGNGSLLTLFATPSYSSSTLSYFSGWSGACTSTSGSSCTVNMTANKSVTAIFASFQPVHIPNGSYYASLQSAYGAAATTGSIQAQAVTITGDFSANSSKNLTLSGGYDSTYSSNNGYTIISGSLTLAKGTMTVEKLVID
jgi:chitinase